MSSKQPETPGKPPGKLQSAALAEKFTQLIFYSIDELMEQTVMLKCFRGILALRSRMEPLYVTTKVGPFFYKFREHIERRNIKFFAEHDYADQLRDMIQLTAGYGEGIARMFVQNVRDSVARAARDRPEMVRPLFTSVLQTYCQYVLAARAEAELASQTQQP